MLRLSLLACVLCCATSAQSADLARQSPLGDVFADRPARVVIRSGNVAKPPPDEEFQLGIALKVPGYYGRATDFHYRSYYGTSPFAIYSRLPYSCGFVGLC